MIPKTKTAQAFALAEWLHGDQYRKNSDEEALKIPYLTHLIDVMSLLIQVGASDDQLIAGLRGLPPFLVAKPGLNSGFMIPQYTAASIVSQNKQLCSPASVDSIVSSNGQEDHVSMGANAATKCFKVVENLQRILAIELFNAAQAIEFRKPLKSSNAIEHVLADFRKNVPFVDQDIIMYTQMDACVQFLKERQFSIG